ncbi:MAG: histidine kinase [Clostridiaceae bacterium]|nr:histidine kinase [Clostridiaceae bacterium]
MEQKKQPVLKRIYIILFVVTLIFTGLIFFQSRINRDNSVLDAVKSIHMTGEYQEEGQTDWIPFQSLDEIPETDGIVLRGYFQDEIIRGRKLMLYLEKLAVTISVNGEQIYDSGDDTATRWDFVISDGITSQDEVMISVQKLGGRMYSGVLTQFFNRFYYGERYALQVKEINDNAFKIAICIIVWVLGIAAMLTAAAFRFLKVESADGYLECGCLMLSASVCIFIDYEYITLIFNYPVWVRAIDFLAQLFLCESLFAYFKIYLNEQWRRKAMSGIIYFWSAVILLYMILRVLGVVDEEQMVTPLFFIVVAFLVLSAGLVIGEYLKHQDKRLTFVLVSSMVLVLVMLAEAIHYYLTNVFWVYFFMFGVVLFTAVQFVVLIVHSKNVIIYAARTKELEDELMQNRLTMVLSQMKPHFLRHALETVRKLCGKDPKTAEIAIQHISGFLQSNIYSLTAQKCILFEDELGNVENYLYIEKLYFGDKLQIDYQLETREFMCPPFVLQNLVENAVEHGIAGQQDGGIVVIATHETEDYYVIQVMDNGIGFDTAAEEASHNSTKGLENIRQSLKGMCDGRLIIESYQGNGTTARIEIPKENIIEGSVKV